MHETLYEELREILYAIGVANTSELFLACSVAAFCAGKVEAEEF